MSKTRILNVANMSFNSIRENINLAKTSEYTVFLFQVSCDCNCSVAFHTVPLVRLA